MAVEGGEEQVKSKKKSKGGWVAKVVVAQGIALALLIAWTIFHAGQCEAMKRQRDVEQGLQSVVTWAKQVTANPVNQPKPVQRMVPTAPVPKPPAKEAQPK